jgi:non-ribosomal peptide synthetase component F
MANFSFDVFTGDWVRALCSGGSLVLCSPMAMLEPARLYDLMRECRVTCAEFVPAIMRMLISHLTDTKQDLSFMRLIAVGSDIWFGAEYAALKRLGGDNARVVNSYGTAETTIDSTYFEAVDIDSRVLRPDAPVPIGRPLSNARVYILDDHLQPVPVGVRGELCIGGSGVARGYLNDSALTAERFLQDPFMPGGRLYRTGDQARYRADGTIELLGRSDQQVKLRGFRIELGEIEGVLIDHPAVLASAVILDGKKTQTNLLEERLIAYLVPTGGAIEIDALRRYLNQPAVKFERQN